MNQNYERIERAIRFLESSVQSQPSLDDIASYVGLSPFHFQRLFRQWAGVSPKRFMEFLTVSYAKQLLKESNNILEVSYQLGLSSPARLHDQFVTIEAITPGDYKRQGMGLRIFYGLHYSPFGDMLLAQTERGVCALSFVTEDSTENEIIALQQQWPNAEIVKDLARTADTAKKIFNRTNDDKEKIHLTVRGTNFQINVWKALLKIPSGSIASYRQVAAFLGKPKAFRAVATANASNPVGFLIPCHRVLRGSGELGGYHWGEGRKRAMIAWEFAKAETDNVDSIALDNAMDISKE